MTSEEKEQPGQPPPRIEIIDTHCHLDMTAYSDDLDKVLDRAFTGHIKKIVTNGIAAAAAVHPTRQAPCPRPPSPPPPRTRRPTTWPPWA